MAQTIDSQSHTRHPLLFLGGVVVLVALVVVGGALPNPFPRQLAPPPTPAATRDGRWLQDVEYLASQLAALHANAFFETPRETFDAATADLIAAISTLEDHQIAAEMVRLAAMLGDGHTGVNPYGASGFRRYPLQVSWADDELLVVAAAPAYAQAIGAVVAQIGDTEIAEAYERLTPYIEHDNAQQLRNASSLTLVTPEFLHTAGLIEDMEAALFTFAGANGEPFTLELAPTLFDAAIPWQTIYDTYGIEAPLSTQNREKYYWYTYLEDSGTIYFQYNRCADDPAQPFEPFAAEMFAFIDANPVRRVIIDLRANGGGNSTIIKPFIDGMRVRSDLDTADRFYALIGRRTFSSALMNAIDLDTQTRATLLGEPTGGKPNGYGEVREFTLPNSGLPVQYSTRFFNNVPGSEGDAYAPNQLIEPSAEDIRAGRDPVFEAALGGA